MLNSFPIIDPSKIPPDAIIHTWCPLSAKQMSEMYYSSSVEFLVSPFFVHHMLKTPISMDNLAEEIENFPPTTLIALSRKLLAHAECEIELPSLLSVYNETKSSYFTGTILVYFLIKASILPSCPKGCFTMPIILTPAIFTRDIQIVVGTCNIVCVNSTNGLDENDALVLARARGINRPVKIATVTGTPLEIKTSFPLVLLVRDGQPLSSELHDFASLIIMAIPAKSSSVAGAPGSVGAASAPGHIPVIPNYFGVSEAMKNLTRISLRNAPDGLKRLHHESAESVKRGNGVAQEIYMFVGYDERSLKIMEPDAIPYWKLKRTSVSSLVIYYDKNCPLEIQQIAAMVNTRYITIIID
jgi:hypothetical protein